jgi:hypothetical protein
MMNNESERTWEEAVLALFRKSWNLLGRTEENQEILSQDSRCPGGESN